MKAKKDAPLSNRMSGRKKRKIVLARMKIKWRLSTSISRTCVAPGAGFRVEGGGCRV